MFVYVCGLNKMFQGSQCTGWRYCATVDPFSVYNITSYLLHHTLNPKTEGGAYSWHEGENLEMTSILDV